MSTHVAPNTPPKHEAFVEQQLDRARGRIRALDLMGLLLLLACVTLGYALLLGLADRSWQLPSWLRLTAFLGYAAAALYLLGLCVYRVVFLKVNPYYAAKRLEEAVPDAKNSLVNWLDLRDEPMSPAIRNSLGLRAAKDVAQADPEKAIANRRTVLLGGITSALACAVLVAFLGWGPGTFLSLLQRTFAPFAEIAIATRTNLELLQPEGGDRTVLVNQRVDFRARVTGRVPRPNQPDSVKLHYRYGPTDPYLEQQLEQDSEGDWGTALLGDQVHNGFWYKITAGDAATPEYQVKVRSLAQVTRFDVTYKYRPYRKENDLTVSYPNETSAQPNLMALRGTEVTLLATTNRALKEGRIETDVEGVKKAEPGEVLTEDRKAVRFRFVLEGNGTYLIKFTSAEGEPNSDRFPYKLAVLEDRPPVVKLTVPGKDVVLPANGTLSLEGVADDDHGIKSLTLKMRVLKGEGETELAPRAYRPGKSLQLKNGRFPEQLLYKDFVALEKLKTKAGDAYALTPGTVLEYWLEAVDNCDYPNPDGNTGRSEAYKVTVAAPEKNAEKQTQERKKAEQQQKQHDQKQDQELEKRNQEAEQKDKDRQENNTGKQGNNDPGAKRNAEVKGDGQNPDPINDKEFKNRENQLKNELEKQAQRQEQKDNDANGSAKPAESEKAASKQGPGDDKKAGEANKKPADPGQAAQKKEGASKPGEECQCKDGGQGEGQQSNDQRAGGKDGGKAGAGKEGNAKTDGDKGGAGQEKSAAKRTSGGENDSHAKGADKAGERGSGSTKGVEQSDSMKDQQVAKQKPSEGSGDSTKGGVKEGDASKQGPAQTAGSKTAKPDSKNAEAKSRGNDDGKNPPSTAKPDGSANAQQAANQRQPGRVKEQPPQTAQGSNKTGGDPKAENAKGKAGGTSAYPEKTAKAAEKDGPQNAGQQVAEAKGDKNAKKGSGQESRKEISRDELEKLKEKLHSGDFRERDQAAEDLSKVRDRGQDPKTRKAIEQALKEAGRDSKEGCETGHTKAGENAGKKAGQNATAKNAGNSRQPPKDAGDAKSGKPEPGNGAGATRGPGKNDIANAQVKDRGGFGGKGKPGEVHEPAATENNPEFSKRAGDLQLEDLKKVTPEMLKNLKWSEKDWRNFQTALEAKRRQEQQAAAKGGGDPDRLQYGSGIFGQQGARKIGQGTPGNNSGGDLAPTRAPAEFQEAQRIFTSVPLEKRKQQ
jgi:hypothetical protein